MLETSSAQPLLGLDPDLGVLLSPERMQAAGEDLQVRVAAFDPGPWRPESMCGASPANVGLLVLSGVVSREICIHDAPSAELLGPGDIIRTWQADAPPGMLRSSIRWVALRRATLALLDRDTALALRRYPEVMTIVLDRLNARAERLAVTQAISQITGVETRVEALLWHLSQRWGRVGREGVIIRLALSRRLIGAPMGARRPTACTAFARLAA